MKPNIKTPRNFINPLLSRKSIDEAAFERFQTALADYKQKLYELWESEPKQSEPTIVASALKSFFEKLGYVRISGYECEPHNQKGPSGPDLAIIKILQPEATESNSKDTAVSPQRYPVVIIEAKVPNSKDMISMDELNKKSFHEAILYFMRERKKDNDKMFHIIVTDFYNWFVFDAKDFERLLWRNPAIKKIYDTHSNPDLLSSTTKEFYQLLERDLPKIKVDLLDQELIDCAHFNLQQSHTPKELIAIYKLLSADNLLKEFNPNDANSLNREFYNELLYILGLEEAKEGGKKVIGKAKQAQHGTLFENISNKLVQYQKPHEFEDVIKLIIIWMNRVLFLKLLESQIVKWTTSTTNQFLHHSKIKQYDQLETLFFEILAKPIAERKMHEFDAVPYLNSSLFEIHADEKMGITIATLTDDLTITYHPKTVAKDEHRQRKTGKVSTLPYLLEFLDAYDFANDSDDEVVSNTKSLISASVLGLIFEKINGYKDGSFYTPSFITMYMARETITKSVIDKFNQAHGWQCKTLADVHNKIDDIPAANTLINRIRICDPAVGSGHFLVSALNEMLCIKSELGVLVDEHGKRIKAYRLSIENDELIIKSDDGELFEYKKASAEKTRIQKTLFNEKQTIIENCLFGVDINPNSVNICRLRLWVELLKNAYYKADGQLDTLPNIDINIKCGNSLISRFALNGDMQSSNTRAELAEYKAKVADYKQNKGNKRDLLASIDTLKKQFHHNLIEGHAVTRALYSKISKYVEQFGADKLSRELKIIALIDLSLQGKTSAIDMFQSLKDEECAEAKSAKEAEAALHRKHELENGQIYQNAFEWRFEFPEVLNEAGEFVGFDVVIGNPPYIFAREHFSVEERKYFNSHYALATYQLNLYILFLEIGTSLLKPRGGLAYITPNNWLTINSAQNVREFVLHQSHIDIVNFYAKVFDDASVDTCLLLYSKGDHAPTLRLYESTGANATALVHEGNPADFLAQRDAIINIAAFRADTTQGLLSKIAAAAQSLDKIANVKAGLMAYEVGNGVPPQTEDMRQLRVYHTKEALDDSYVRYLDGRDVQRYGLGWSGEYLLYGNNLAAPRKFELFSTPRILVRQIPSQPPYSIHACYTTEVLLNDRNSMNIINIKESPLFLLGVLNSRLMTFWFVHQFGKLQRGVFPQFKINELAQFPIAIATDAQKAAISERVAKILADKKANPQADITLLNTEIDQLVYALYQLTPAEIALIEEKSA